MSLCLQREFYYRLSEEGVILGEPKGRVGPTKKDILPELLMEDQLSFVV
jgi:hypothetical protein